MEEKDFIEYYRKRVEQGSEKPLDNSWDQISRDLDIDEVWDNVSTELDIDEVWVNVSAELDKDKRKKVVGLILSWSSAAVILMLVGLFIFERNTIKETVSNQVVKIENSKTDSHKGVISTVPTKSNTLDKLNDSRKVKIEKTPEKAVAENRNLVYTSNEPNQIDSVLRQQEVYIPVLAEVDNSEQISANSEKLDSITLIENAKIQYTSNPKDIDITQIANSERKPVFASNSLPATSNHYSFKKRISIGVSSVYKSTWLINRETIEGFHSNDLNSTKLRFATDIGFNVKYAVSERWSIESSGFISSRTGQSYNEYIYGDYSRKNVTLRYTSAELTAKYTNYSLKLFSRASFNSVMGFYFSKLRSANESVNDSKENVYSQYSNVDYGLILGQEVEIRVFNRVSVAPSLRFKIGVPNVYLGESDIPSSFKKTHNGSFDFRIAIYYKLFK